jgi:hypothetical protein
VPKASDSVDDGEPFTPTNQQRQILIYLRDQGATNWENRLTADYVATEGFGSASKRVKDNLALLKRQKLVGSTRGPDGGYWILPPGLMLLVKLGHRPDVASETSTGNSETGSTDARNGEDSRVNVGIRPTLRCAAYSRSGLGRTRR